MISKKLFVLPIPFNLNYLRAPRRVGKLWGDRSPLTVVDVGSRGSPPPELLSVRPITRYIGFDASKSAHLETLSQSSDWRDFKILREFIGSEDELVSFYNYTDGGLSSSLEPNPEYVSEMADSYGIENVEIIQSKTLRQVLGQTLDEVDFLKLDTQGTELDILVSEGVSDIPLIEVEVEFMEVYAGQPLFDRVFSFMNERGYRLLWLTRHFGSPQVAMQMGRGSLVFGEALFGLSPSRAQSLEPEKLSRYLLMLSAYGHADYAEYLSSKTTEIPEEVKLKDREVIEFFSSGLKSTQTFTQKVLRIFLEKVQFLAGLTPFRNNGMQTDSDRAIIFR